MPVPRRPLLSDAAAAVVIGAIIAALKLVEVDVRGEEILLRSQLLRGRSAAIEWIRAGQIHQVLRQPKADLRVGPPVGVVGPTSSSSSSFPDEGVV